MRLIYGVSAVFFLGCFAKGIDPPESTPKIYVMQADNFYMGSLRVDPCGRWTGSPDPEGTDKCTKDPKYEVARYNVKIDAFCIDSHEVTIDQYRYCVANEACGKPTITSAGRQTGTGYIRKYYNDPDEYGDYPVLGVSWIDASKYCDFMGGHLPHEAQWEYVAKHGDAEASEPLWEGARSKLADACQIPGVGVKGAAPGLAWGACTSQNVRAVKQSALDVVVLNTNGQHRPGQEDLILNQNLKDFSLVHDLLANASEWTFEQFDQRSGCSESEQTLFESRESDWWKNEVVEPIKTADCLSEVQSCVKDQCQSKSYADCIRVCFNNDIMESCRVEPGEEEEEASPRPDGVLERYTLVCFDSGAIDLEPWCAGDKPEDGLRGDAQHIRYRGQDFYRAAVRDEEEQPAPREHVIRGGDYLENEVCEVRPSRRRRNAAALPNTGFRCAYPAAACQP